MELYRQNAAVGENVRIAVTDDIPVTGDYWLFDNCVAALMRYNDDGIFINTEIVDDQSLIHDLVEAKDDLLDWSEPIAGFWDRHPRDRRFAQ